MGDNFEMKAIKAMGAMEEGDAVFGLTSPNLILILCSYGCSCGWRAYW